jgi:hypothetical protein
VRDWRRYYGGCLNHPRFYDYDENRGYRGMT